jgi:hypothetical protein
MRAAVTGSLLSAVLTRYASAYDAYDPATCNGPRRGGVSFTGIYRRKK